MVAVEAHPRPWRAPEVALYPAVFYSTVANTVIIVLARCELVLLAAAERECCWGTVGSPSTALPLPLSL